MTTLILNLSNTTLRLAIEFLYLLGYLTIVLDGEEFERASKVVPVRLVHSIPTKKKGFFQKKLKEITGF